MKKDEILAERETIIRWDGHKDAVHIYTASKVVDRKIRKAGHEPAKTTTRKGAWSGSFYELPYKALRWGTRLSLPRQIRPTPPGFRGKTG